MYGKIQQELAAEIQAIRDAGLYKVEREITTSQGVEIRVKAPDG